MSSVAAVVLAAGRGDRFGAAKQFEELVPGLRLVDVAVKAARTISGTVVLVLPPDHDWHGVPVSRVVAGGATRSDSVRAGLEVLSDDAAVVVLHDAAHPLAPQGLFGQLVEAVRNGADAAVPFFPVPEVVKRQGDDGTLTTVGRDGLGLAQMPMAFSADGLRKAHGASPPGSAWEDSMLLEMAGMRVVAVAGSNRNLHVVTAADLEVARMLAR